jgi:anti-sigma factor RsiW|tara:strand:- start:25 stop:507 length:483 start_codon:yes stop_codon:yes gene_type:complete
MNNSIDFTCADARPLVPAYLDGELTADRASPLRQHLMECADCRTQTQAHKTQHQWFVPTPEVSVPEGFAARVARRAFQGDTGEAPASTELLAPVLPFVLKMTAAAAGLLLVLSGVMRAVDIPTGGELRADDAATMTLEEALDRLEMLDGGEGRLSEGLNR